MRTIFLSDYFNCLPAKMNSTLQETRKSSCVNARDILPVPPFPGGGTPSPVWERVVTPCPVWGIGVHLVLFGGGGLATWVRVPTAIPRQDLLRQDPGQDVP